MDQTEKKIVSEAELAEQHKLSMWRTICDGKWVIVSYGLLKIIKRDAIKRPKTTKSSFKRMIMTLALLLSPIKSQVKYDECVCRYHYAAQHRNSEHFPSLR